MLKLKHSGASPKLTTKLPLQDSVRGVPTLMLGILLLAVGIKDAVYRRTSIPLLPSIQSYLSRYAWIASHDGPTCLLTFSISLSNYVMRCTLVWYASKSFVELGSL